MYQESGDAARRDVPVLIGTARRGSAARVVLNLLGSLAIIGIGIGGFVVYGGRPEVPKQTEVADRSSVAVQTAAVTAWQAPFDVEVSGEATTYRVLTIGAEVAGRVTRKPESTRGGVYVTAGQTLLEIDPLNYQLEVARLRAQLALADEEIQAVAVDLENARSMWTLWDESRQLRKSQLERLKSLYARKAASESDVDAAAEQELSARNSLQSMDNQLATLTQQNQTRQASRDLVEVQLRRAEADLSRCQIVSPITGRIVDDVVEQGDYVRAGDELVHISDARRMEIRCSLRASDMAWIWQQELQARADEHRPTDSATPSVFAEPALKSPDSATDSATASTPDSVAVAADVPPTAPEPDPMRLSRVPCEVVFPFEGVETVWDGYLARFEGTGIDRETRLFPFRVVVEEPGKPRVSDSRGGRAAISPPTLLSGMFVKVRIPIRSPRPLLQIPGEAIRPGSRIWVVKNGQLQVLQVSIVRVDEQSALVIQEGDGLAPGDHVVISPLTTAQDGMSVHEAAI